VKAGALGEKTNDSHTGGCMFTYAPNNLEKIATSERFLGEKRTKVD